MNSRELAIKTLEEKGEVVLRCNGGSMRPILLPKEAIHVKKVAPEQLRVGDAVFCRINHNLQVHKITHIDQKHHRYEISNNLGFRNGVIGVGSIFGLAVRVEDRVLVSDEELAERAE